MTLETAKSGKPTAPPPAAVDVSRVDVCLAGFAGALGTGLRDVLARDCDLEVRVVGDVRDVATAVGRLRPDALLIKYTALPTVMELRRLVVTYPAIGVMVGVMALDAQRDQALLAAGARVVVPLTMNEAELCAVVRLVGRGLVGPPRVTRDRAIDGLSVLTPREAEVFERLARRLSAGEIASALHIAPTTVNAHTRRIYQKLGVHSRAELAALADRHARGPDAETSPPTLSRDRVPYGRRAYGAVDAGRPSAADMRAAMGIARWPRTG